MFSYGKTLFVDVYDNKPPGIFLLFGIIQMLPINGIVAVRIFAALFITFTAWFLYRSKYELSSNKNNSIAVGILYIMLISLFNWGLVANTEIFFIGFSTLALYLITVPFKKFPIATIVLGGLALGLAYIIKFVALFDFIAIALLWLSINHKQIRFPRIILLTFLAGIAFALPFALIHYWYYAHGFFEEFTEATYIIPTKYATHMSFMKAQAYVVSFHLITLPVILMFYLGVYYRFRNKGDLFDKWIPILWYLLIWYGVFLPGKNFFHYFAQLFVPICFFAPDFFNIPSKINNYLVKNRTWLVAVVISLFFVYQFVDQYREYWAKPDTCKEIAKEINSRKKQNDLVFTNYRNTIYYLCDTESPSKWVHTSLLFDPKHIKAMGINKNKEIQKIIKRSPAFIVWQGTPEGIVADYINNHLHVIKKYNDQVCLYAK